MEREKPHGQTGPIRMSGADISWERIKFPGGKAAREMMIAEMFVTSTDFVTTLEHPELAMSETPDRSSLRPFRIVRQNPENDLDFTVETAAGEMLLELAEFAPLQALKTGFAGAPKEMQPAVKAPLLLNLIRDKSAHQGGAGRVLLIYNTEQAFWVDPMTVEMVRRSLQREPPKFERIYVMSPHNHGQGTVTELFPGRPHHTFGQQSDDELVRTRMHFMGDLSEWAVCWEMSGFTIVPHYGRCCVRIRCSLKSIPGAIRVT